MTVDTAFYSKETKKNYKKRVYDADCIDDGIYKAKDEIANEFGLDPLEMINTTYKRIYTGGEKE